MRSSIPHLNTTLTSHDLLPIPVDVSQIDVFHRTVTEKHTTVVWRDKKFWVGLSDMQGWRISGSRPVNEEGC